MLELHSRVIQAPMAGAQDSALAIAVCQAGGIGSLPCAFLSPDAIRSEIATIKTHTDQPFNVNFFCHEMPSADEQREQRWREVLTPFYRDLAIDMPPPGAGTLRRPFDDDAATIIEEMRPPIVSFHFGLPRPELLDRVRATGALVIATATTVAEALWLDDRGVDAIVAQGVEAGGHRGMFLTDDVTTQLGTFALVPQIVSAVSVPVIAAGGIVDARGVAAALTLGAAAVQVGTAYLLCPEAAITSAHRAALVSPAARHTALTNVFTGRPARGIVNRLMREIGPMSEAAPPFPLAASAIGPLRSAAEQRGQGDFSPLWAGEGAPAARPMSAAELTRELCRAVGH